MVLTLDIGNTNIVAVGFDNGNISFVSRISTDSSMTVDEYAIKLHSILHLFHRPIDSIEGAAVSSVVPPVLTLIKKALSRLGINKIIVVGPGVKSGLDIKIDDPAQLGADFVCEAVAAKEEYTLPVVVVDLGTATKLCAIDGHGTFLGGAIMPGVSISLDALVGKTAQLPQISLDGDMDAIGTNTVDCMRSGVVLGAACMIDGMVKRYTDILGSSATVIATGGIAPSIIPHCRSEIVLDPDLVSRGLYRIYTKNK